MARTDKAIACLEPIGEHFLQQGTEGREEAERARVADHEKSNANVER